MTTVAELEALVASMPKSRTNDINIAEALAALDPDAAKTRLQKALRESKANEARAVKERDAAENRARNSQRSAEAAVRKADALHPAKVQATIDVAVSKADARTVAAEKRAQTERERAEAAIRERDKAVHDLEEFKRLEDRVRDDILNDARVLGYAFGFGEGEDKRAYLEAQKRERQGIITTTSHPPNRNEQR